MDRDKPDEDDDDSQEDRARPNGPADSPRLTLQDFDSASEYEWYLRDLEERNQIFEPVDELEDQVPSTLSHEQQDAWLKVIHWWQQCKPGTSEIFRLYGYAGTGKTSLARHIAARVGGQVVFLAYTGKAALALVGKGCAGAKTIHRFAYNVFPRADGSVEFILKRPEEIKAHLIIIDECSMINDELASDLMSFGRPILAIGDPFQLPPIDGESFFKANQANFLMTQVLRQALSNPIIQVADNLRRHSFPGYRDEEQLQVMALAEATSDMFIRADQIIVGLNVTRHRVNKLIRRIRGFEGPYPEVEDRLVCLKSNKRRGLVNGSLWRVFSIDGRDDWGQIIITVRSEDDAHRSIRTIRVHPDFFLKDAKEVSPAVRKHSDEFDYAYALTAHKAQGSQWSSVLVINECLEACRAEPARWLYTAGTGSKGNTASNALERTIGLKAKTASSCVFAPRGRLSRISFQAQS